MPTRRALSWPTSLVLVAALAVGCGSSAATPASEGTAAPPSTAPVSCDISAMWVYEAYGGGTAAVTPDGSPVEQEVTGLAAVEAMLNLEAPCEFANLFAGSGGYLIYVLPTVTDARRAEIVELARNVAPELPFGGFGDAVASRAEATLLIQEIQGLDPSLLGADFLGASMNLDGVVVADAFGPELDLSLDEIRAQLIDLLAYDPGAGLVIEEPNVAIGT